MQASKIAPDRPMIVVLTGVQAAGKSTIGRLLAERFARGVHVEADVLHRMIVSGDEWAREPGSLSDEAARQLRLRLRNMCLLGGSFYEAGFTVVLDDIILGDRWEHLQEDLRGLPFCLVVLAPRLDVVGQRDVGRGKRPLGEAWARYLDEALRTTMAGRGLWIDNSDQQPEHTVDCILRQILPDHMRALAGKA